MNCERKWVGARKGIKCATELLRFVSGRTQAAAFAHLVLCFIYATIVGVMDTC